MDHFILQEYGSKSVVRSNNLPPVCRLKVKTKTLSISKDLFFFIKHKLHQNENKLCSSIDNLVFGNYLHNVQFVFKDLHWQIDLSKQML